MRYLFLLITLLATFNVQGQLLVEETDMDDVKRYEEMYEVIKHNDCRGAINCDIGNIEWKQILAYKAGKNRSIVHEGVIIQSDSYTNKDRFFEKQTKLACNNLIEYYFETGDTMTAGKYLSLSSKYNKLLPDTYTNPNYNKSFLALHYLYFYEYKKDTNAAIALIEEVALSVNREYLAFHKIAADYLENKGVTTELKHKLNERINTLVVGKEGNDYYYYFIFKTGFGPELLLQGSREGDGKEYSRAEHINYIKENSIYQFL